jgi:hypothetical protein
MQDEVRKGPEECCLHPEPFPLTRCFETEFSAHNSGCQTGVCTAPWNIHHLLHELGHAWSVPSSWRVCWSFHLNCGHPPCWTVCWSNRYYRVLTMVYNTQRYQVFGLCPSLLFFKYPDVGQSPITWYLCEYVGPWGAPSVSSSFGVVCHNFLRNPSVVVREISTVIWILEIHYLD